MLQCLMNHFNQILIIYNIIFSIGIIILIGLIAQVAVKNRSQTGNTTNKKGEETMGTANFTTKEKSLLMDVILERELGVVICDNIADLRSKVDVFAEDNNINIEKISNKQGTTKVSVFATSFDADGETRTAYLASLQEAGAHMSIQEVEKLAKELKKRRETKADLEKKLTKVNESIKDIEENKLNSAMLDLGVSQLTVNDLDIKRTVVFRGGCTSNQDKEAFKYLYDTNNEGALKKSVLIDLDENPDVATILDDNDVTYKITYAIHHATLSSILKTLFEEGKLGTDDIEKYSIYVQPQIKIK